VAEAATQRLASPALRYVMVMRPAMLAFLVLGLLVPGGTAHAAGNTVWLREVTVNIAETKADGRQWDVGALREPDLKITVRVDGRVVSDCDVENDRFRGHCALDDDIEIGAGARIEVHVLDADLGSDDEIGIATIGGAELLGQRSVTMKASGRLVSAVLAVGAPALLRTWPARAVAVALGVALPLLLLWIYGRRFLTPVDPERKRTRFWRSPVLLAGTAAGILGGGAGLIVAKHRPDEPLVAAIPIALGAFACMAALIDTFHHERLGGVRGNVLMLGAVAIVLGPVMSGLLAIGGLLLALALGWMLLSALGDALTDCC